jgi:hypothetical protein
VGRQSKIDDYQPVAARPSLIRKDYGLILDVANEGLVPMPLAHLIHDRLTATVAKGREVADWAGFAREVATVVIGGETNSTLLTHLILPVPYDLVGRLRSGHQDVLS